MADFFGLLFPNVCRICGNSLFTNEKVVCSKCFLHLPETNFHRFPDNAVAQVFWGRIPLAAATALLYYRKGGAAKQLIHQLKYHGDQEVGLYLGNLLGSVLLENDVLKTIDCIVPVPLHEKKLKKRGFNQSEVIARGIREVTKTEVDVRSILRTSASETQTKKSRYRRWENVRELFQLDPDHGFTEKHILVLDDVITTGATMEACVQSLKNVQGIKISIAAAAFSRN